MRSTDDQLHWLASIARLSFRVPNLYTNKSNNLSCQNPLHVQGSSSNCRANSSGLILRLVNVLAAYHRPSSICEVFFDLREDGRGVFHAKEGTRSSRGCSVGNLQEENAPATCRCLTKVSRRCAFSSCSFSLSLSYLVVCFLCEGQSPLPTMFGRESTSSRNAPESDPDVHPNPKYREIQLPRLISG